MPTNVDYKENAKEEKKSIIMIKRKRKGTKPGNSIKIENKWGCKSRREKIQT